MCGVGMWWGRGPQARLALGQSWSTGGSEPSWTVDRVTRPGRRRVVLTGRVESLRVGCWRGRCRPARRVGRGGRAGEAGSPAGAAGSEARLPGCRKWRQLSPNGDTRRPGRAALQVPRESRSRRLGHRLPLIRVACRADAGNGRPGRGEAGVLFRAAAARGPPAGLGGDLGSEAAGGLPGGGAVRLARLGPAWWPGHLLPGFLRWALSRRWGQKQRSRPGRGATFTGWLLWAGCPVQLPGGGSAGVSAPLPRPRATDLLWTVTKMGWGAESGC